jgi:endonuclease/exonuclease/phosphatase family metal-dependent hydrolase
MERLRVVTWNVLHRVHGENWQELPIDAFPDERERTRGVVRRVAEWLDGGVDAVCLQEASGDLSAALDEALGARARRFAHVYPRVPKPRTPAPAPLGDPRELLLTFTARPARQVESATFATDPGKGLLAIELGGVIRIVNTHVSSGPRRDDQLARVRGAATAAGAAVVVGDFNAPADVVGAALGVEFAVSDLRGQPPTRSASRSLPGKCIDHVAAFGGELAAATVIDVGGLSDHNAVVGDVDLGA